MAFSNNSSKRNNSDASSTMTTSSTSSTAQLLKSAFTSKNKSSSKTPAAERSPGEKQAAKRASRIDAQSLATIAALNNTPPSPVPLLINTTAMFSHRFTSTSPSSPITNKMKENVRKGPMRTDGNVPQKRKKGAGNDTSTPSTAVTSLPPTPPATSKRPRFSLFATDNATDNITTNTPSHRAVLEALASTPSTTTPSQTTPATATTTPTPQTPSKKSTRKSRIPTDPLNITIYSLRKQALEWDDIAMRTNRTCGLEGTDGELTSSAAYSRFFRNGPLVARSRGEEWRREWYVHMKKVVTFEEEGEGEDVDGGGVVEEHGEGNGLQLSEAEEQEVVDAVEKAQGDIWTRATATANASLGKVLTKEQVREVYDRIKGGEE